MTKRASTCPSCGDDVGHRSSNKFTPFCSERCQLVDLSRWLDGQYRIPGEPSGRLDDDADDATADNYM